MTLPLAKLGIADYVNAVFTVYLILLLLNILISWVPRMPYRPWLRPILDFITETTNPYLNLFRRFTKPITSEPCNFGCRGYPVRVMRSSAFLPLRFNPYMAESE